MVMPARRPEVGVGRAEDDAHHQAEDQRPDRELAHRRVVSHERLEFGLTRLVGRWLCHEGES